MKIIKQCLAIDVDSKELKASFRVLQEDLSIKTKGSRTFKNTVSGFSQLHQWAEKKRTQNIVVHLVMEATGVYYENAAYYFDDESDYVIHVVLGNVSNAYFKSLNNKSKTDEIDANALAQLGLERQLKVWKPVSKLMYRLKRLTRERLRMQREKTMVMNQLHAEKAARYPSTASCKRYQQRIDFLKEQIKQVEADLEQLIQQDPDLKQKIKNVCTAVGVGLITAINVVAEYNGFALFENRGQVVSYAGYDVVVRNSGTSIRSKPKISKKGNSYVRQSLYMAAMSAAVHDKHHKTYYERIVDKTGIKMKANVAIQRKLLLLIYTLFKNNMPYDPKHHVKMQERLKAKLNMVEV